MTRSSILDSRLGGIRLKKRPISTSSEYWSRVSLPEISIWVLEVPYILSVGCCSSFCDVIDGSETNFSIESLKIFVSFSVLCLRIEPFVFSSWFQDRWNARKPARIYLENSGLSVNVYPTVIQTLSIQIDYDLLHLYCIRMKVHSPLLYFLWMSNTYRVKCLECCSNFLHNEKSSNIYCS